MCGIMGNDGYKEVRNSSPFWFYWWCFGYQHMTQIMPSTMVTYCHSHQCLYITHTECL